MNDNLNNNQTSENLNATPYKAMGNMNTVISNPNAVINDTMDINIQSQNISSVNSGVDNNVVSEPSVVQTNTYIPKEEVKVSNEIKRTYVTNDNKPKKRTVKIKFGPELKIALLIIVILLVFIFILPLLPNFF